MSSQFAGKFSVVIPTLQRSHLLREVVERSASHPLVEEVLVINNAPIPLDWSSPKMRVLQQTENIFVNPAWNLGAREAKSEFLAIVNDDVLFGPEVFDECARILHRGRFSMAGPAESCFGYPKQGKIGHRIAPFRSFKGRYGTFMALRRTDYWEIPEQMKIWGGDDWLFLMQRRPNAVLVNTKFETEMSVTSGSPEFSATREESLRIARHVLLPLYRTRWWHRAVEYLDRVRS
ncbi:GT2 family glycosyltransferase [Neomicrococcus aestuarii]|uniref:GT2 family glycosyltransferase n=1 Tax=Neomicrococcus aestuarii TaxID=556325 RepID=A0A7W8WXP8_9MICC|nr:glycosyltransferase [Neomicrococcus aestuarii]MBB5511491.1 GT2 family glycosyltransferase [Neomicrococcus aestuarii]